MINYATELLGLKPSWFCGDAAGRKGDFSVSDLYFAHNANVEFKTPEHVFTCKGQTVLAVKSKKLYHDDVWDSYGRLVNADRKIFDVATIDIIELTKTGEPQLIVLVGPQGSGKSTLANNIKEQFKGGTTIINRDTLKTSSKMMAAFVTASRSGQNIIIDNTNGKLSDRAQWLEHVNVTDWLKTIIYFDLPKDVCFHLTQHRLAGGGQKIPSVAIHTYYKYLEPPSEDDTVGLSFIPMNSPYLGIRGGDVNRCRYIWR